MPFWHKVYTASKTEQNKLREWRTLPPFPSPPRLVRSLELVLLPVFISSPSRLPVYRETCFHVKLSSFFSDRCDCTPKFLYLYVNKRWRGPLDMWIAFSDLNSNSVHTARLKRKRNIALQYTPKDYKYVPDTLTI